MEYIGFGIFQKSQAMADHEATHDKRVVWNYQNVDRSGIVTKYFVTWTVFHLAAVDADNPDDAPAKAKEFAASNNTAVSSSDVAVLQRPEDVRT